METDAIKKFILQIPFFKAFNDNELNKLVGREKVFKDCKKGDTFLKKGIPAPHYLCFCLERLIL